MDTSIFLLASSKFGLSVSVLVLAVQTVHSPGPVTLGLSIKQSQFRISIPLGSGVALCEGVRSTHGSGYRKSRFQPGIRIHTGTFNVHFENFSLSPAVNSFARWDTDTWSLGVERSPTTHNATHES